MSLVRWDPFHELDEMNARFNRLFGRSGAPRSGADVGKEAMTAFDWAPSVDIAETPEEFRITAELPQVKKEDIHVSVEDRVLRIEGERKQEKEEKDVKLHRIERSYGSFLRTFSLPENVDAEKIHADSKDGVLVLHLPKSAAPTQQKKRIEIK